MMYIVLAQWLRYARETLHTSVTDPVAASMNFLNEVAGRFPDGDFPGRGPAIR